MTKRMMHNIIAVIIILCVVVFFRLYEPPQKETNAGVQTDTTTFVQKSDLAQNKIIEQERYAIDPNTAALDELLQAGFTRQQAFTCIKYRKSGGVFRYKDDISKLYTVSAEDYENLKAYIDLPAKSAQSAKNVNVATQKKSNKPEPKSYEKKTYETKQIVKQDLNTIDSVALTKIPFIGAFRTQKILETRKKWGGFYCISQLKSLYSFDSTACANVEKHCYINVANIQRVNLNTCTFKEIQNLPASSYYIAKNIFDYKKIVGTIQNVTELVKNNIVEREKFEVLKYYLRTE
ncbi:MAG: helix-hairpin-helix domain-containing protein [Bacteroidetes bacterium]|nr:helix-hairpin-helix domain-containing protein [Bacteroidota bacterium]